MPFAPAKPPAPAAGPFSEEALLHSSQKAVALLHKRIDRVLAILSELTAMRVRRAQIADLPVRTLSRSLELSATDEEGSADTITLDVARPPSLLRIGLPSELDLIIKHKLQLPHLRDLEREASQAAAGAARWVERLAAQHRTGFRNQLVASLRAEMHAALVSRGTLRMLLFRVHGCYDVLVADRAVREGMRLDGEPLRKTLAAAAEEEVLEQKAFRPLTAESLEVVFESGHRRKKQKQSAKGSGRVKAGGKTKRQEVSQREEGGKRVRLSVC